MSKDRTFYLYYPGNKFPSISLTGTRCKLNCGHCGSHYLTHMVAAEDPASLLVICKRLDSEGAAGVLISGGCDSAGKIELSRFFGSFKKIKDETGLSLNLHTGLLDQDEIEKLKTSGIDAVSFDLVGDPNVITDIYHLKHKPEDYLTCLKALMEMNIRVVPHICIGLSFGSIAGELNALRMLAQAPPKRLIFIIFIPTKGTRMENILPPSKEAVYEVIANAKELLPKTELVLGCMRPRRPERYETAAVSAGVTGVVLPSSELVTKLEEDGVQIIKLEQCCAL